MAYRPQQLLKRLQRLERDNNLHSLLEGMKKRRLSHEQKLRLLNRIATEALGGNLTAREANTLTKAVEQND
jgi:hypothetical protein